MSAGLRRYRAYLSACLALSIAVGCSPADKSHPETTGLTPVTLQLNWYPEAEHGGYYAALVHGYYRDAGLDVTIVSGGPDTPVIQQVARGKVMFGVVNADNMLFARAQQAPVVALMAPLQTSPRCLIVHEKSGITNFEQLQDMTIAMSPSSAFTHYLQHKLPLEGVRVVPYSGSVAQFLVNADYGQQGYVFSEPFVARKAGGDPHVLMVSDLGFNPYTSLLFTSDALLADNPDLIEKMVSASARGWQKYLDSPAEANRHIHEVNPEMDLDILEFGAAAIRPLVLADDAQPQDVGAMTRERWQTLADQLIEIGQLKQADAQVDEVFTNKFLAPQPSRP